MGSVLGATGDALVRARRFGCSGRRDPFLWPMNQAFLRSAKAVVVHSAWAHNQLEKSGLGLPLAQVPLSARDPAPLPARQELRRRWGLEVDALVLMHLGFLTVEKGVVDILNGLAGARRAGIPARLVLVGEGRQHAATLGEVERLGIADAVTCTGWVEPEDFPALPMAADLGIVLRQPSAGETSAAVLRFLACGTPVAVCGLRQFLEWPEPAAPRITPGRSTAAEVARLLAEVGTAKESGAWEARRRAARQAYEGGHRPQQAADALVSFLEGLELTT
jgi:glycosyltransferase involved in cell wall biosynthesis